MPYAMSASHVTWRASEFHREERAGIRYGSTAHPHAIRSVSTAHPHAIRSVSTAHPHAIRC
eukprot:3257096-Rhodomonas_salina.1